MAEQATIGQAESSKIQAEAETARAEAQARADLHTSDLLERAAAPGKAMAMLREVEAPETETRVDEFAIDIFATLGYTGRLPDTLVRTYNEFKRRKDRQQPGRLSPEGFAFVDMLACMTDNKLDLQG